MAEEEGSKSEIGLDENIAGLLCYLLTWITGIIFLLIEKKNDFVRFHAMQSIVVFLPLTIISWVLTAFRTPYYGYGMGFSVLGIISSLITILIIVLWIVLMIKAYQGEKYKLPIAGDIAEKQLK